MKTLSLLSAATALLLSACDRHQWEGEDGVKELYKHHDESHGSDHGGDHDGKMKDEGDHGGKAAH